MAAHAVDPARVYVAGLSAGGAMAAILGRTHPDLFAAVGVHSGLPTGAASDLMSALSRDEERRAPQRATAGPVRPTIVFHGDADTTVHPRNGERWSAAALAGAAGGGRRSRTRTQRPSTQAAPTPAAPTPTPQGRIAVEHWLLHGAGHAWAGGSAAGLLHRSRGAGRQRRDAALLPAPHPQTVQ